MAPRRVQIVLAVEVAAPPWWPGTFFVAQSWAGCITDMPGFNLRQAQQIAQQLTMSVNRSKADLALGRIGSFTFAPLISHP